jgi:hypothetical protein
MQRLIYRDIMVKIRARICIIILIILLCVCFFTPSVFAALNVSDPLSSVEERYEDYIYISSNGFASSSKEYYFLTGALGRAKISLNGSGVGVFRVTVENHYGRSAGATNPYNRESSKVLDLDLSPGGYKVKIVQNEFSFFYGFMFYALTMNHLQPAPIIESLVPANGAIVSHNVKLGVYLNEIIRENPSIFSVDVLVDNDFVDTIALSPFEYIWDTSAYSDQYHTIEFRPYDILGRYYPLTINVKVDNSESQTSTDSFHDSIPVFWGVMPGPYKEYFFETARDGMVNVLLSGEDVRYAAFSLHDENGNGVGGSRGDLEDHNNFKSLDLFLKKGKYSVRVKQIWHGNVLDMLVYSLTVNHPSANLSVLRDLNVSPNIVDPSGDDEVKAMTFSYDLLEDAYVLIKLENPDRDLLKTIQPISFRTKGIYNISSAWNGLSDEEKISNEGVYFFVVELYDENKSFMEKQSVPIEIKYHLGY